MHSTLPAPRPRLGAFYPRSLQALALLGALAIPGSLVQGAAIFSSNFNDYTNANVDSVRVNGGTDNSISITGGGSNAVSPSGYWTVANSAEVDLATLTGFTVPAALTGGSSFTYGDASVANSQLKKGAVFTTRSDFTYTDGVTNAAIRYAAGTAPNRGNLQANVTGLNSMRFNVFFEIKSGAPARTGWELALRYGTAGTGVDTWTVNTAAENGTASGAIYQLNTGTGVLDSTPVVTFASTSVAGTGPSVTLAATNSGASLGTGIYLLSVSLTGKTKTQRYTIDDLVVSATAGASEIILDNSSAGVTQVGAWVSSTAATGYLGTNYITDGQAGKGSKSVRYSPTLVAGVYAVSIRYPAAANHDVAVPVDVSHAQGVDLISVNQTANGGAWQLLGNYRFNAGSAGYVQIGNTGTTGLVVADAVRFTPISEPSDPEVLADGLADWRTPDGNGISCAQCHGPAGYDVAVFSFAQSDLRRATAPHLNDAAADRIFKMIELHRRNYPPAGGLKDVATFRPFQPTDTILGGVTATQEQRDAAFGNYVAANFLYGQNRIDTLAQARAARDQLVALDIDTVPIGIAFNRWSESVSRQGAEDGGKISEWLPAIGLQVVGANAAAFTALEDAYVANPTDANFWAVFHKIDAWTTPDPHNVGPVLDTQWVRMAKSQLKSNLIFQHDQLLKSQGITNWVTGRTTVRPFQDQEGQGSTLSFLWDVADAARIVKSTPFANLPQRNQDSMWIDPNTSTGVSTQINRLRNSWFYLGWTVDHSLFFTGPSNSTRSGEYFIEQLWVENYRAHQVFFNTVHLIKRGFLPGAWSTGNLGGLVQHYNSQKPYYLGYNRYQKGTDAAGYPGSAATYKLQLANSVRIMALLHDQDIKDKGYVYTVTSGGKTTILNHVETMRAALDWADATNKTANDAILDALITTINAYPLAP